MIGYEPRLDALRPDPRRARVHATPTSTGPSGCATCTTSFCARSETPTRICAGAGTSIAQAPTHRGPRRTCRCCYVRMAPHVSRFVARLFGIEAEVAAIAAATAEQDVLFRFKADFVRRRVLPLLKGGAARHGDRRASGRWSSRSCGASIPSDGEMALARAGCLLLDREIAAGKSGDAAEKAAVDVGDRGAAAVVRRAPARRRRTASWVVFRLAENVDYFKLVEVEHRDPDLPTAMEGPAVAPPPARRLHADRPADDGPRGAQRDQLLRPLPRARQGLLLEGPPREGRQASRTNPLGIPLEGCPLDEKISEMHMLRKRGDAIGALALVTVDNPMCPGTGHRICNDCMKACIFQKQEPVNIPQIETGILTDVLRLPWGVEIYGLLTRWNPLNVRRPVRAPLQRQEGARRRPRPGRLHARALPRERGLRRRRRRRPEDRAAAGGHRPAPTPRRPSRSATGPRSTARSTSAPLEGFGGVSEYGITVRWDKNFLTLLHLTLARRATLRMYGGIRFGGTLLDGRRVGATGSTTWRSPPAPASRRSST